MLTADSKKAVMSLLENSTGSMSTIALRNKAKIPKTEHASLRAWLNGQVRRGVLNRTNRRPFYWSIVKKEEPVFAPVTFGEVQTILELAGLGSLVDHIDKSHPLVYVLGGDTFHVRSDLARLQDMSYDAHTKTWSSPNPAVANAAAKQFNLTVKPAPSKGTAKTPAYNPFKTPAAPDFSSPRKEEPKEDSSRKDSSKVSQEEIDALEKTLKGDMLIEFGKMQEVIEQLQNEVKTLKANRPIQVVVKDPQRKKIKVLLEERVHPIFEQVMFHITCGDNVMLVGPKGCGKTTLAKQISKAMKLDFGLLSLSGGTTESKLLGRSIPNVSTGENHFHFAPFARLFRDGNSLFLLDEIDGGDPNVLLCLNSALANGCISIDTGNEEDAVIKQGKDAHVMAAANTWGSGANRKYVGRNAQDSAFTDRFVQIAMDYDKEMEMALCAGQEKMVEKMHEYRKRIEENRLERELGTRQLVRFANWLNEGKDMAYVEQILFSGWPSTEVSKVKF